MEDINWQRQNEQQAAGQELYQLELRWGELVASNYQLNAICSATEVSKSLGDEEFGDGGAVVERRACVCLGRGAMRWRKDMVQ